MQKLQDIDIRMESPAASPSSHGNASPVLYEILHALQRLQQSEKTTTIDLRSLPFGPGDEAKLFDMLGRGEVQAQLHALGTSEIWETAYAGVWVVEHKNSVDERIALQIEVTRFPEILQTQQEDLSISICRLDDQLNTDSTGAGLRVPGD